MRIVIASSCRATAAPHPPPAEPALGFDHVAFRCADLAALAECCAQFDRRGIRPETAISQGFCCSLFYRDPDDNEIELLPTIMMIQPLAARRFARLSPTARWPLPVRVCPLIRSNSSSFGRPVRQMPGWRRSGLERPNARTSIPRQPAHWLSSGRGSSGAG
ncbi:VOC family protein [Sphingopyxis granuli]|uniref:VOC family protein n=1 Tax=Sphingopyxis granuli TaxID=267128 RepID=UPI003C774C4C